MRLIPHIHPSPHLFSLPGSSELLPSVLEALPSHVEGRSVASEALSLLPTSLMDRCLDKNFPLCRTSSALEPLPCIET